MSIAAKMEKGSAEAKQLTPKSERRNYAMLADYDSRRHKTVMARLALLSRDDIRCMLMVLLGFPYEKPRVVMVGTS